MERWGKLCDGKEGRLPQVVVVICNRLEKGCFGRNLRCHQMKIFVGSCEGRSIPLFLHHSISMSNV